MSEMANFPLLQIDGNVNAAYVQLNGCPVARTDEVTESVLVDLTAENEVVGIEVLNMTASLPIEVLKQKYGIGLDVVAQLTRIRPSVNQFAISFSAGGAVAAPLKVAS